MSDPLGIAAGVIGVLTAATQISSLLIHFTKSTKKAPKQAQHVLTEINDTNTILSQLQSFPMGKESADRLRSSLLKLDHVVTIVSSCVETFAELEKLMDEMRTAHMDVLDCVKWARKETDILALIKRLQNHKSSLSLILHILNGATITEPKPSVPRLYDLVSEHYQAMSPATGLARG